MKISRSIFCLAVAAAAAVGGGCSMFRPYPATMQQPVRELAAGNYAGATRAVEKMHPPSRNQALYLWELGACRQAAGEYKESSAAFLKSAGIVREFEERAVVSARDVAAFTATLLVNDNARPYSGSPFEHVLMHTYLAVNFLMEHNVEDARVEVLQAYARQKEAREAHEKEIAATRREAANRKWDQDRINAALQRAYGNQRELLDKPGNVYQNAFTYYLSSVIYEMNGEISDAYIDAKTVHGLNPNFFPAREALLRYSREMGLRGDYDQWRKEFGETPTDRLPEGCGEVVALYGCGLAPYKDEFKLALPIPFKDHWTMVTIALPKYRSRRNPVTSARLRLGEAHAAITQPLMDVEATAVKDLWDQAPQIAIRHLLRSAGRVAAAEYTREKAGPLASLLLQLFGYVLEQPDRRSWLTLPRDFQALRVAVPAGSYQASFDLLGPDGSALGHVEAGPVAVSDGSITFINLRSTGIRGTANSVTYAKSLSDEEE